MTASSNRSKMTRFGSTDEQGNRLSNMPGEERPSLASVTPYDDDADTLAAKVDKMASQITLRKPKKDKDLCYMSY
jgi:hypothetical protein